MAPPTRISISKARENFADVVGRVRYGGRRCVLTHSGKGAAALISIEDLKLLEALEEHLEEKWAIEAIRRARAEGGTPIPAEDVFRELGLDAPGEPRSRTLSDG